MQLLAPQLETKLQYGGKGLRVRGMPFPRQGDELYHGGIHLRRRIERTGPDHKAPLDPDIALDPDRQRAVVLGPRLGVQPVSYTHLTLTGFGTFVAETRQERQGRNPRTGDVITIAASKVVRFRPGKMLKDALNK